MTLMTNLRGFKLPPLHLGEECSSVFMLMGCTQTYQDTGGGVSEQAYVLLINKISLGGGRALHNCTSLSLSFMSTQALYTLGSIKATCFQVVSLTNAHNVHWGLDRVTTNVHVQYSTPRVYAFLWILHAMHVMCMLVGISPLLKTWSGWSCIKDLLIHTTWRVSWVWDSREMI